jgi:hypothetical protein
MMTRNKILNALRRHVPEPLVTALDQQHQNRVVVRDPSDHSDGSKWGRWLVQVFRARPVHGVTVWNNPSLVLDQDPMVEPWIVAFDGEPERTGFRDELDIADFVAQRLRHRNGRRAA